MTEHESKKIIELKEKGNSYNDIAELLGLSVGAVKSFYSRHKPQQSKCLQCGAEITQKPHRKEKKFCSDKCRISWWNQHPQLGRRSHHQTQICRQCNRTFDIFRKGQRKFCCSECYNKFRKTAVTGNE